MSKSKDKSQAVRHKGDGLVIRPYAQYEMTIPSKHISFYISDSIGAPSEYVDMIHRIKTANPQDVIYIHLNTPGGYLDTGVQIINAIRGSQAHIVTVLESAAKSLGALIFLAGDEYQVFDDCMLMFHTYSSGMFGKGNEQQAELIATTKWFNKLMKKMCHPFLTHEEIDRMIRGEDLWLDTDEIRKRLNKLMKDAKRQGGEQRVRTTRPKKSVESAAVVVDSESIEIGVMEQPAPKTK